MRDLRPAPSLEGTTVLFVAGYVNEIIPGYFDDTVASGGGPRREDRPPLSDLRRERRR
jgi:hypothetical protein